LKVSFFALPSIRITNRKQKIMPRPKGLGRGLDALLAQPESEQPAASAPANSELQTVAASRLTPGKYQPRTHMDDASLDELAASIKEQGLMQPIIVRKVPDGKGYEIIAGERRWRAAQRAGLKEVPVLVKDIPDQTALAWSLIENIQRENLNPLEEAQGLHRLITEFKMTHDTASQAIGRSRSAVTNLLRLLQLSPPAQKALSEGKIEMGHARAILVLPPPQQELAVTRIINEGLSVRQTEHLVSTLKKPVIGEAKPQKPRDADTVRLEEELSNSLGAKVQIDGKGKKGGKVIIHYANLDVLDGILSKLKAGA
jgi:ParB family chromosome partitioning protein